MRRFVPILLAVALTGSVLPSAATDREPVSPDARKAIERRSTSIGNMGLFFTNLGYVGNLLDQSLLADFPSCEYPLNSNVEHLYMGGIWVGGITSEGDTLVSAGADDTPSGASGPAQEFGPDLTDRIVERSSNVLSTRFNPAAQADQDFLYYYDDLHGAGGGGQTVEPHQPLGLRVKNRVLAFAPAFADDFVILDYEVENVSGREIRDVYVGFYTEFSVGNITVTIPGDQTSPWNFYDDFNGFYQPGDLGNDDPDSRMMFSYDDDGEDGRATTWIGLRMLGADTPEYTFSYRQWPFRQASWPDTDRRKYEYMASEMVDVGRRNELDFSLKRNWSNMLSTGPWDTFNPGETIRFTVACVAGADSTELITNSQVAQALFDEGFRIPKGPPSPLLSVEARDNQVILRWPPGRLPTPEEETELTPGEILRLAQPEFHVSDITGDYDFQGYRIYRIRADSITQDPFEQASLIAQFDRAEWPDGSEDFVGFNTGMPPMDSDGFRYYVDNAVLNGFNYYYAVTSYASKDPRLEIPELESGFNENSTTVTMGSLAGGGPEKKRVSVYPNPYRAASLFDNRLPGGAPAELGRNIYFSNVPARAQIEIFNVSGARIDVLRHDDPSTGQVAWDMLSENTRALAPGLYIWAVTDLASGEIQRGKFVILK